jgi:hypothetical protein
MATLPAITKTWQFNVNQRLIGRSTQAEFTQRYMLAIKQSMVSFLLSPWTIKGSSNSVTAGMDGVDRWLTFSDLIWNGAASARSWITLRQPGLGPSELTIDLVSAGFGDQTCRFIFSPGGNFAGGTTTARPIAADEVVAGLDVNFGGAGLNSGPNILHVAQSTDGQCTRIFTYRQGAAVFMMCIEQLAEPVTNFAQPYVVMRPQFNQINNAGIAGVDSTYGRYAPVGTIIGRVSAFGTRNRQLIQQLSYMESANCWPFSPMGFYVTATVGARGRHGLFQDMWLAPSGEVIVAAKQDGDTYPDDTNLYAQLGPIIMPWGGNSAPRIAL